ncbi:cytochrome P450 alkane hydroxylase [Scheffersomyces xylosifermentans]|uniref:cytochrome P450 alkane hydroxylase n=1 Tax=Scheffersomyces xylosifermentans TaxID=1304137 RepID=UPI00315C56A8
MSEFVEVTLKYLTKWYVVAVVLISAYVISEAVKAPVLRRKLGAKPFTNIESDGYFGFQLWRVLLDAKKSGELVDFIKRRYGLLRRPDVPTFTFKIVGINLIATKDPENIKAILATQFNEFALGKRQAFFNPLLGDGIFTLDGEGWKHSRAMLRPQFAREQVAHVQSIEPHIQVLARHIRNAKGKPIELQQLFFKLTVDSATEFLFGQSVESLRDASVGMVSDDFKGKAKFATSFNKAQDYLSTRALLQQFYWLVNNREFRECNRNVHEFADYYVQKALEASPEELEKTSKDGYIFLYELVKQTRDPKTLRDQLLNILLAGRDTTAGLLSFSIYELARSPEIWAKLKEEIYEKFGSGDESRVDEITFDSLKRCEYLKAFLNEVLRLYPSVPQNFRVAVKDTTLPRGGGPDGLDPVLVRKGQSVLYSIYSTQRDEDYYGKDAEVFRPERWFEPSTRKLGWAYLPFNGGPRICLGQQFALTEASYVITRLVQLFPNIESHDKGPYPPTKCSHLTMSLQEGAVVALY